MQKNWITQIIEECVICKSMFCVHDYNSNERLEKTISALHAAINNLRLIKGNLPQPHNHAAFSCRFSSLVLILLYPLHFKPRNNN